MLAFFLSLTIFSCLSPFKNSTQSNVFSERKLLLLGDFPPPSSSFVLMLCVFRFPLSLKTRRLWASWPSCLCVSPVTAWPFTSECASGKLQAILHRTGWCSVHEVSAQRPKRRAKFKTETAAGWQTDVSCCVSFTSLKVSFTYISNVSLPT